VSKINSKEREIGKIDMEYVHCNLCGCDDYVVVFRKTGKTVKTIFNIVKCRKCGLVYVNPRLTPEFMKSLYNDDYYNGEGVDSSFLGSDVQKEVDAQLLMRCLKQMLPGVKDKTMVLEVGGGQGVVSHAAMNAGFSVLMSELSQDAIKKAQAKGINSVNLPITDDYFKDYVQVFDAVIALEVIEHLTDPMGFFHSAYRLLKPNGVLIYTSGNFNETRLLGSRWGYLDIPEVHIHFFTPATIKRYLKIAGFNRFLDPYKFYYKMNIGTRILEYLGIINLKQCIQPDSFIERLLYSYLFKLVEIIVGRNRFVFAVK
jgi:2-polyprenyl-3-methyl-5-hydroxy-6-metoxy-1,4-benzoquinol methylase